MNDVQAAMDAFSKDDEVAQVSPLFPTAEKELLEDLRDQYLAANAKLKGKNTLRQKGEGEHDVGGQRRQGRAARGRAGLRVHACVEIKILRRVRRLLDGVAMPVPRRSTEPARDTLGARDTC